MIIHSCFASQTRIVWNQKVHRRAHKRPPRVSLSCYGIHFKGGWMCLRFPSRQPWRSSRRLNRATDITTTRCKMNNKQNRSYIWRQNILHIVAKGKSFKNGPVFFVRSEEQFHFQPSCWSHVTVKISVSLSAENLKGNETCLTQYHTHWPYKFLVRRTSISSNVNNGHLAA
jgi:hypothetical protein